MMAGNKRKPVCVAAAVLATVLSVGTAFAGSGNYYGGNGNNDSHHCQRMGSGYHHQGMHRGNYMGNQKDFDRSYTADEIRTLSEARLIRQGNPNLKVGKVVPTESGYKVTIVTKDNSLVEERKIAKNGMSLERYNAIKTHMVERNPS
ncbi:hypothetical protein CI610_02612 [invertebrate metagenome]|uniref:Uncharacterized protein n=1 Tax=invertebrate metagenome TaxID=1711999 RepID=A0A2H9T5F6_9ZZZZ